MSSNLSQATSFLFFSTKMITFMLCNIFELIWYSEFILGTSKLRAIKNTKPYFWHILIYILKRSNPLLQRVCISDILTAKKEQNNSSSSNSIACTASNNRIMGFKKIRALFVEVLPIKAGRIYEQSVFYSSEWSTHFFSATYHLSISRFLKKGW